MVDHECDLADAELRNADQVIRRCRGCTREYQPGVFEFIEGASLGKESGCAVSFKGVASRIDVRIRIRRQECLEDKANIEAAMAAVARPAFVLLRDSRDVVDRLTRGEWADHDAVASTPHVVGGFRAENAYENTWTWPLQRKNAKASVLDLDDGTRIGEATTLPPT